MEIDLVIPWVDGNDPKWLAEKRACLKEEEGDGRANRFREWDNLEYLFRGIEKKSSMDSQDSFYYLGTCTKMDESQSSKIKYCKTYRLYSKRISSYL